MTECDHIHEYLDETLAPEERAAFAAHLRACPACSARAEQWNRAEAAIRGWSEARLIHPNAPGEARLRARFAQRVAPPWWARLWRPPWILAGAAAAAAGMAALIVLLPRPAPEPLRVVWIAGSGAVSARGLTAEDDQGVVARVGDDRVGLERSAQVEIIEATRHRTRLRLRHGRMALRVHHDPKRVFVVEAAGYHLRVVGTELLVSARPHDLRVAVAVGRVVVETPAGERVEVGERESVVFGAVVPPVREALAEAQRVALAELLANAQPPDAVETPRDETKEVAEEAATPNSAWSERRPRPKATLELWRRWTAEGEAERARVAIEAYLRVNPSYAGAWSVLADAQRKVGNVAGAEASHREVIKRGGSAMVNRSRYLLAAMLQEQHRHEEAIDLLRSYLRQAGPVRPLEAVCLVRLATSLSALGKNEEARRELQRVVEEHPEDPAADDARRLLR